MERKYITLEEEYLLKTYFVNMVNQHYNTHFTNFASAVSHFKGLPYVSTCKFSWQQLGQLAGFDSDEAKSRSFKYINSFLEGKCQVKQITTVQLNQLDYIAFDESVVRAFTEINEGESLQIFSEHVKELASCDSSILCSVKEFSDLY
ncbi:Hypothetical_protein [Hexamita inflata]|uniref:Hypothetical_protein n=1 Tax=Hexamita inflata TaxID=28002 RepID=A0ABP1IAK0_9EUKA